MSLVGDISKLKQIGSEQNESFDSHNIEFNDNIDTQSTISESSTGSNMNILKRVSSWWRVKKPRSNSNDKSSVTSSSSHANSKEPAHFYKMSAIIRQCRYREGYRETMFKCAQECNAYYSKEGRMNSIYFYEDSQDLHISLLFPSYGNAKQFQNIMVNLNNSHPLYKKKIDYESKIFEEHNLRGFQLPEPVQFDDYKFDENNDSMPFLSVLDLDDGNIKKKDSQLKTPPADDHNDDGGFGLGGLDGQESGVYIEKSLSSIHLHIDPSAIAPMKVRSRSSSPAPNSVTRDEESSSQRFQMGSREQSLSRCSSMSSGSLSRSDSAQSKSVIRIDSDPSRALQSLETLPTNLKLKCYCCHLIPKSSDDYQDDPDNAIYGTWLFRQCFDGQIKDDDIPEISIKYLGTDGEADVYMSGHMEKRTKVEVLIEFRDSTMAQSLCKQFKEGTVKINDTSYRSFLYAKNESNMERFINNRYQDTIRLWEKDKLDHVAESSAFSDFNSDDFS